jgi:hypothetical protein
MMQQAGGYQKTNVDRIKDIKFGFKPTAIVG